MRQKGKCADCQIERIKTIRVIEAGFTRNICVVLYGIKHWIFVLYYKKIHSVIYVIVLDSCNVVHFQQQHLHMLTKTRHD